MAVIAAFYIGFPFLTKLSKCTRDTTVIPNPDPPVTEWTFWVGRGVKIYN